MAARLYKCREGRLIFGVCAGVAECFHLSATLVRIVWAMLALCGPAAAVYLIAAVVLPYKHRAVRP